MQSSSSPRRSSTTNTTTSTREAIDHWVDQVATMLGRVIEDDAPPLLDDAVDETFFLDDASRLEVIIHHDSSTLRIDYYSCDNPSSHSYDMSITINNFYVLHQVSSPPSAPSSRVTFAPIEIYGVHTMMQRYGGGFANALGLAIMRADLDNARTIKRAFPQLWQQYYQDFLDTLYGEEKRAKDEEDLLIGPDDVDIDDQQ